MKVVLPLPKPTNAMYRHHGHTVYMIANGKEWLTSSLWNLKTLYKPPQQPTELYIRYYLKRDRDVDGSHKIILDLFEKAGWYTNDNIVKKLTLEKFVDKVNPRVEVELLPISVK